MNLLFDQNISYRIIRILKSTFPKCKHVNDVGLENETDEMIWEFAREHDFTVVTFDADFYDLSIVKGIPPKIIWLRSGNTSTLNISHLLIEKKKLIKDFCDNKNTNSCLEIH